MLSLNKSHLETHCRLISYLSRKYYLVFHRTYSRYTMSEGNEKFVQDNNQQVGSSSEDPVSCFCFLCLFVFIYV
jgi:hypothetical protein